MNENVDRPSCMSQGAANHQENLYFLRINNLNTKNPLLLTQITNENIEFLKKNDFEIVNVFMSVTETTIVYKNSENKLQNFEQIQTFCFTDFSPLENLQTIDLNFDPQSKEHSLGTPHSYFNE